MKITLNLLDVGKAVQAVNIANDFLSHYPDNHRSAAHPERNGVGYRFPDGTGFFAFGDAEHVRVEQST